MEIAWRLVGRERERDALDDFLGAAAAGQGALVLVAGEAGVGKTTLLEAVLGRRSLVVLRGAASQQGTTPYAPLVTALRACERASPGALRRSGPLAEHLAVLLPELGAAPDVPDRLALVQAVGDAFAAAARSSATVVFLDDLQWADEATLDVLPPLAASLAEEPLLVVAAYRSDEIPRSHPLRRLRAELRRAGRLCELSLSPLEPAEATELTARVLGRPPGPRLARALYDRTEGVPLYLEEFAAAIADSRRLEDLTDVVELVRGEEVPLPETLRDAVLVRADRLSEQGKAALEVAAAAGARFDLQVAAEVGGAEGLEEGFELGFLVEAEEGVAAFRHALVREALYAGIPWTRRRAHHRRLAEALERRRAPPAVVAEQWLAARDDERARPRLLAAAEAYASVHAYRDAARLGRLALELWPEGEDEARRLVALERLGHCAELSGQFDDAARAWEEAADAHRAAGDAAALAETARRLAGIYEREYAWERALAARRIAARAFAESGRFGDAAAQQLTIAEHLAGAGSRSEALGVIAAAAEEVERAGVLDLRVRSLALEGEVRTDLGDVDAGLALVREALALALAENAVEVAAEAYFRLAVAHENASDRTASTAAYETAYAFCRQRGVEGLPEVCFACLAPVLLLTGEWRRLLEVCGEVLRSEQAPPPARMVAMGEVGLVRVLRGERGRGRRLLGEAFAFARQAEIFALESHVTMGLARADELNGRGDAAAQRLREFVARCQQREERHYSVPALRWATTLFATSGSGTDAGACAELLSRAATATGAAEAAGALAHALGELALLDGEPERAARQFEHALELLGEAGVPYERAESQVRAAVAHTAAGDRAAAVTRLLDAYRTARKLGARPLAVRAEQELETLGERVERRLGGRAGWSASSTLSRRELEVLRLAARGRRNREIAADLFLSKRTVDMHMRNVLAKLDCRSRVEAAQRANELGLLS